MFKPFAAAVGALFLLAACSSGDAPKSEAPATGGLTGAGSTFFAPLASKWAETYKTSASISVNYQSIGSGGGIKQIKAKTVDFGATDKPLSVEDLNAAGLYQFPVVMGGVVPVVNVPGIEAGKLNLNGQLLADIFMGKIKRWDDPALKAANPGLTLPALPVTVVHRADGSGTTYLFTNYLAAVSPEWKSKVGASDALEWPTGLGGKGNEGVSAFVSQTTGSIGYVEFAYAIKTGAAYANLTNHDGQTVAPSAESFAAAAAGADWKNAPGNQLLLLNQPGAKSWPITGAVFILVYKDQADAAKAKSVLNFFDWAYTNGDAASGELHYVPLPADVKALMRAQWASQITSGGKPVFTAEGAK
ncbi:phosphate ABC transporter substrate-binding protein PstS [Asticcacaulis excentricus]|uniref:Phosphate-binding protein PstS n=1 Tax=Asticcacaulis excentricus (strain ATCC 15261 / DSM 4724 / KCTC 12464 / NCIMB 9791 / VKM B-1370 / CB 48) TaxID=573065 RepID=E8RU36_ASTEC|nr:phosphate ABC transporter substrate-binding protein PstS [Asticcacaulis excentricus]ADU15007.1 phosphate ABC transporter, periplasmic phosphate-binding protein [Asticcacaulis excentricus CB 48]